MKTIKTVFLTCLCITLIFGIIYIAVASDTGVTEKDCENRCNIEGKWFYEKLDRDGGSMCICGNEETASIKRLKTQKTITEQNFGFNPNK